MSSEKYLHWCPVENSVSSRLKDDSLAHTIKCERRIHRSTKLINKILKTRKLDYSEFIKSKQKILQQPTETNNTTDLSDFNDNDYKTFYASFNVSCQTSSDTDNFDGLLWNYIDKKGRNQDKPEDYKPCISIPNLQTSAIKTKTTEDFENFCKDSKTQRQKQTTENAKCIKKEETPKNLIKSKSTAVKSTTINNKKLSSVDNKVTVREKASTKKKQSLKSKQSVSSKSSKDVKKNLTSILDNISLRSQESAGDEWNDDFAPTEFQAQSTQIFSDTFSEKKATSKSSIDHRSSHEVINQPRDSGIEEDSREDNAKFKNQEDEKKYNKNQEDEEKYNKNQEDEKKYNKNLEDEKSEPTIFNRQNVDNLKVVVNKLNQNEIKNSPNKRIPLKIIGEERVTKKFKIIAKKDNELKLIEEKNKVELSKPEPSDSGVKVNSANEKSESSSESDSDSADFHSADDSQYNKSDSDVSDQFYDLKDDGSEEDSEDTQNQIENDKAESDNSSMNESIIRKRELKEQLKRCKSPFMIRRYNELKKSGALEESDVEPKIKKIKNSEKKSDKRTLHTPSKSSKNKKTSQFKVPILQDVPKRQKRVKDDESFEEKTLIAENFIDNSVSTNRLNEDVKELEDDVEEETPNVAKLQQLKSFNLLAGSDESDASEDENIHKKAEDKTKGIESSRSPNSKQNQQQVKRLDTLSTYEDSDESENENKIKTVSSKRENVQNISKSNEDDSDSAVSETTYSQSSPKIKQYDKQKEKSKMHTKLSDKGTSSGHEESVEIYNQSDLKNVIANYKRSLLTQIPKKTEDLNESDELSDIDTQFQPMESPDHEDSDDSENSEAEKTVINMKNKSKIHKKESDSDSEKKDDILENEKTKVNNMKQEAKLLKESSSEEDTSDLEELEDDIVDAVVSKNENSEDECIVSSESKENLSKRKRLDLLNSDEDSDDSQDGIIEKNDCNSDIDIEEHKVEAEKTVINMKNKSKIHKKESDSDSEKKGDILENERTKVNNMKQEAKLLKESSSEEDTSDLEELEDDIVDAVVSKNENSEDECIVSSESKENLNKRKRLDLLNSDEDSDDSQDGIIEKNDCNSDIDIEEHKVEAEKTVINMKNKSKRHKKENDSDSEKKDDILENERTKVNIMKQEAKIIKESSSEEGTSDLEELNDDIVDAIVSKNENSEDECIMSSKSKENLNKMKRLDLLNSDEDSDDSQDGIIEKNDCNSDIDIEEHKIDLLKKHKVLKRQLKSSDYDSSDKSDFEMPSAHKTNKSKSKHLSSGLVSCKDSGAEPDIDDKSSKSSKNKSKCKRKFSQIDAADTNSMEASVTSQEIDVVHYSSENDISGLRKFKKFKSSNSGATTIVEEEHIDTLSQNSFKDTKLHTSSSENDDSGSDQAMSHSSKQKVLQLRKMNLLDNNSSSSSEDDKIIESSQCKLKKKHKMRTAKKNSSSSHSDSDSDSEKKKHLDRFSVKINKKQNQEKENEELDEKDDESDVKEPKHDILDDKKFKKMNLLENNSSSSSEDDKIIESSQCKLKKKHKKRAAKKNSSSSNSDSDSDSEKEKDLDRLNVKINKKQNQEKENEELDEKDDESDVKEQKDDIIDDNNFQSEDSEDQCTMSSKTKERLNKMKRLDLLNSDEDSEDSKDRINNENYCNSDIDIEEHKVEDIVPQHDLKENEKILKSQMNSSDSDSGKSNSHKSQTKTKNSTKQKLKKESSTKTEITSEKSPKLTSTLVPTDDIGVEVLFEKEKDGIKESKISKKHNIIKETQESIHSPINNLESQPMFSSLEDLREGIDEKQLNPDSTQSDGNANSEKDSSKISPTQAPKKMFKDKITKISELVEKEDLEKITCQSTLHVNNISVDEDIFVFEVPKTMFNENLIGKKLSFSKKTLTVGDNKYEAFQKTVSPTYSCIFKTKKKALDSFITQNIRPVATIIARRKKFIDESPNNTDNEIDEDVHEYSTYNETAVDNGNNALKDKNTKTKVTKKVAKTPKKSEKKKVLDSSPKLNKEESAKNVKSKKNMFDIENFVVKASKTSKTDNSEKESKKPQRKKQALSANSDNNNLGCSREEAHIQTKVKKTPLKEAVNITTFKDNKSKKPLKSPGKLKKVKSSIQDVKKTEDNKVPAIKTTAKPVKTPVKSKTPTKKRKAENQANEGASPNDKQETRKKQKVTAEKKEKKPANPDDKQETRKKQKVTAEKKEKKPASKKANPRKPKKKEDNKSGESAADQIRKLIAKNIKFDESLNASFDPSNYNPLNIDRIPKRPKRCQSTTSDSSDDESKFARSNFHVRVKSKPEDDKSAVASTSSADVKSEDKKTVKKVFFNE